MSIPVDLDELADAMALYPYGYLLTTAGESVKAVTVTASVRDGVVVISAESRGSATNLDANATATLLCPPLEPRGYSLIVDGSAAVSDAGFELTPSKAVLHRPADHADDSGVDGHDHGSGCGHDCRSV